MAKTKISEFSSTPGNNTDIDSINIAEGCAPSGINDAIRELMAQLKDFQQGTAGDSFNGPVGTTTAAAGAFTTLSASGAVTLSGGTANGVAYLNGSKVLTTGTALTFDGTRLTSTTGKFGSGVAANSASLMVNNVTNTATGIQLFQDGIESWIMGMPANSAGLAWSASGSEQMRLTSTGLGIGTSSPSNLLQTKGSGAAQMGVYRTNSTTGVGVGFEYAQNNASSAETVIAQTFGVLTTNTAGAEGGAFTVHTKNAGTLAERMRLDSSGNLGLGVTPSAWSSYKAIQVGQVGAMWANPSGTDVYWSANYYFGSGSDRYIANGLASYYRQSAGVHSWGIAPSGTAGNAISFTQAMTLSAAGYLGIGTTNPPYGLTVSDAGGVGLEVGPGAQYSAGKLLLQAYNRSGGAYAQMDFAANLFTWLVSGTERARIDSSGNLLVGTTSNTNFAKVFALATSSGPAFACQGYSGDTATPAALFGKFSSTTTTSQVFVRFTTNNNTAGSGQINADGAGGAAFGAFSDARLKENIADLPPQLGNICALRPVEFDYIQSEGGGHQTGFIAQEMQAVYPDAVGERAPDGMLTITGWSKTDARLVKAIQEQQAIIEDMKTRLAAAGI